MVVKRWLSEVCCWLSYFLTPEGSHEIIYASACLAGAHRTLAPFIIPLLFESKVLTSFFSAVDTEQKFRALEDVLYNPRKTTNDPWNLGREVQAEELQADHSNQTLWFHLKESFPSLSVSVSVSHFFVYFCAFLPFLFILGFCVSKATCPGINNINDTKCLKSQQN